MNVNTSAGIPRPLNRFTRLFWLVFAVATVAAFLLNETAALQTTLIECDSPTDAACNYNFLTTGDARVAESLGLSVTVLAWTARLSSWIARLSMAFIGLLLFWRRPDDWVAWLMSLALLSTLVEGVSGLGQWQVLADATFLIGVLAWLPLLFIFPNGRVEPRWLRWVILPTAPLMAASFMFTQDMSQLSPVLTWLNVALIAAWWVGLGGYSMIYRYRRVSNIVERQQTKWVVVGFFFIFMTSMVYIVASALYPPWQPSPARLAATALNAVTYAIGYAAFAGSLGVSILRYRLWDIDLIIRRTLLYSALTATLALTYFAGVVVLQQVFGGFSGGSSNAAIIASTLLIAALFQPLRRRLQDIIDRRFYRRKYDTAQALAAFAATARDNLDLAELTSKLQDVVDDTMQPAHSTVWLNDEPVQG